MNRIHILIVIISLGFVTRLSGSETQSLTIGLTKVSLGSSKASVLTDLKTRHRVVKLDLREAGTRESYSILDSSEANTQIIGVVGFEADAVAFVSRQINVDGWPSNGQYSFGRALFEALNLALSKTDPDGAKRAMAALVVSRNESASTDHRNVTLRIEDVDISISILEFPDSKSVALAIPIKSPRW